jgi:methylisocitrate lyase
VEVTGLRLAMKAVEDGFRQIKREGGQAKLVDKMQTRKRLYELIEYDSYVKMDKKVAGYKK